MTPVLAIVSAVVKSNAGTVDPSDVGVTVVEAIDD